MSGGKLNIELFRAVRDKIITVPEAYDQGHQAYNDNRSPCGTVACIGGWADILSAPNESARRHRMNGHVDLDRAANTLGLSGTEFWTEYAEDTRTERAVLFTGDPDEHWPEPFAAQFLEADTPSQIAQVAVAYLDHIIATGKVLE